MFLLCEDPYSSSAFISKDTKGVVNKSDSDSGGSQSLQLEAVRRKAAKSATFSGDVGAKPFLFERQ